MDGLSTPFRGMPPETPLAMAAQSLRQHPPRTGRPASSPRLMGLRRLLVVGGAILLTAAATREMVFVLGVNGLTPLAYGILALFVSLFAWIALALTSAIAGFVSVLAGGGGTLDTAEPAKLQGRTALLMPAYNEAPARIMAALEALQADLAAAGAASQFDLFILSDTRDPAAWLAEEAAFLRLRARIGSTVFYRRRAQNTERKAGNIADWVRRWGGAYDQFLILDADSVMTADCVIRLVAAMERTPAAGLIQSLPVIVGGRTLFRPHAAIRRPALWAGDRAWDHLVAWGGGQLLGPQRRHSHPRLRRRCRAAVAAGPQAVRRPYPEPRFCRGGAAAPGRLGNPHDARHRR